MTERAEDYMHSGTPTGLPPAHYRNGVLHRWSTLEIAWIPVTNKDEVKK